MKLTPSSVARRRTASAAAGSLGGPQIPSPVMRMAPKPRRRTASSPPSKTLALELASRLPVCLFIYVLQSIPSYWVRDRQQLYQQVSFGMLPATNGEETTFQFRISEILALRVRDENLVSIFRKESIFRHEVRATGSSLAG